MRQKETREPLNIPDMFFYTAEKYLERDALVYKVGHHYEKVSYKLLREEVLKLIVSFKELGLNLGDRAIIISENRPEWVITDMALTSIGVINVPIHTVLSTPQLEDIISEIQPKVILFSDGQTLNKLVELKDLVSKINLVSFEEVADDALGGIRYFKQLIDKVDLKKIDQDKLIKEAISIDPENIASIIYTSGTSGHFKGVKLTHNNFIQNMLGVFEHIWAYPEDKFFSILPLSHVFERTAGYYVPIYSGASIGYSIDISNVSNEIRERRPTIVLAVPRLFEKIYEKVMANVNSSFVKKMLFRFAFGYTKRHPNSSFSKFLDKLVFKKVRDNFGGEIRFFVSGGAALPAKIGEFFERVGMIVLEGYGLTETSPVIGVNSLEGYRFGTVGKVLSNLDVKISAKDEILVKGPSVMKGYLKESDNKEAFTSEGYFRTGDLGYFDRDKFLVISGRMKDLLVLTTGKKVAPVPIEEALEMSVYIEQTMVFGEGRKHIGALIVPNYDLLAEMFGTSGVDKLRKDKDVIDFIAGEAAKTTKDFASYERIKKFILLPEPFSIENGEMTPKLSLRRHVIMRRYADLIEGIYE